MIQRWSVTWKVIPSLLTLLNFLTTLKKDSEWVWPPKTQSSNGYKYRIFPWEYQILFMQMFDQAYCGRSKKSKCIFSWKHFLNLLLLKTFMYILASLFAPAWNHAWILSLAVLVPTVQLFKEVEPWSRLKRVFCFTTSNVQW